MLKKLFILLVLADWFAAGAAIARLEARIAKLEAEPREPVRIMHGHEIVHQLARYKRQHGLPGEVSI